MFLAAANQWLQTSQSGTPSNTSGGNITDQNAQNGPDPVASLLGNPFLQNGMQIMAKEVYLCL